jgi:tRNA A-37 threonylcarbamoyl transferase component Bud32/membrane-associated phospholipid phosphatase
MDGASGSSGVQAAPGKRGGTVRRRRPSGEPPPLPRTLGVSGRVFVALAGVLVAIVMLVLVYETLGSTIDRWNAALLRGVVRLRAAWLTPAVRGTGDVLASRATVAVLRLATIAALIGFRRWRHLLVLLASVIAVEVATEQLSILVASARPVDVTIIGSWAGFSFPSAPVAALAVTLVGAAFSLLPAGRPRSLGIWTAGAILLVLAVSRMYLAIDHPTDLLGAAVLGIGIPVVAFRMAVPDEVFPVAYRRGRAAHLDVGGRRGEAIRRAAAEQLGLSILEATPIGLEGSGGSTPLRLRAAATDTSPERIVFAKLYAKNHVRADRSYKLGRAILYGALEDEAPFQSVRRFVEYEDYILLLLRQHGIRAPRPFGVVEITPEREYMIVMEFFEGAREIGEADVDDRVIDSGLRLVRSLWDAGLAHRDIKPANLMVRDGEVLVIDVFFVQVRPSPWRQAVDLANMMLVLALRTEPARVLEAARSYFTEDEIAEAFAAARGVAVPTQLRAALKRDGRDLTTAFRRLAVPRRPVAIQRWTIRRLALAAAVVAVASLAVAVVVQNWRVIV